MWFDSGLGRGLGRGLGVVCASLSSDSRGA